MFLLQRIYPIIVILLIPFLATAQGPIVATFDTKTQLLTVPKDKKIPFDERFIISINDSNITEIRTRYKIHQHCKNITAGNPECAKKYRKQWHYRFLDNTTLDNAGYVNLLPERSETGNFTIYMDPLHPNETYKLEFVAKRKIVVNQKERAALKKRIVTALEKTYLNIHNDYTYNADDLNAMSDGILNELKTTAQTSILYDASGTSVNGFIFDHRFPKAQKAKDLLLNQYDGIAESKANICGESGTRNPNTLLNLIKHFIKAEPNLKVALDSVLTHDQYKDFLNSPANAVVDKATTNKHILNILFDDTKRRILDASNYEGKNLCREVQLNRYLFMILAGQAKITGNLVEAVSDFDSKSMKLILSALLNLSRVKNHAKQELLNWTVQEDWVNELHELIDQVAAYEGYLAELKRLEGELPDMLEGMYSKWTAQASIHLATDIETKETPYIGADIGALYAPEINSFFVFEGINFHFRPVNRRAKLSDLQGFDELLKKISLNIGIAQRIGDSSDDAFEKRISIGTPFLGLGWRVTRIFRLNGGAIFYKEKSEIPTISQTNNKAAFSFGISIDVKLKDAFAVISKIL